jgi:beta-lactam-binding protein with PASTA domain
VYAGIRSAAAGAAAVVAACTLSSCGGAPSADRKSALHTIRTTTTEPPTTSTSTTSTTSTTTPGVAVPNIIGAKIAAAHIALRMVGLPNVALNTPCNKGSLASQSVVSFLAIPGKVPDLRVGAVPLSPGAVVPPGTRIGIIWSGCFGDAATVPAVVGLTFAMARHDLHAVGLAWACYSVGSGASTTTAVSARQTVLTQTPGAGSVLHPGSPVSLTMRTCPQ